MSPIFQKLQSKPQSNDIYTITFSIWLSVHFGIFTKKTNWKCSLDITKFQYPMVLSFKVQIELNFFNTLLMFQSYKGNSTCSKFYGKLVEIFNWKLASNLHIQNPNLLKSCIEN